MSRNKVESFIEDLKEEGFEHIIILATPSIDSDLSGEVMAIIGRNKEALAMICAAISTICENDPKREMEALNIIEDAFEEKNKLTEKLKKTKKNIKEEIKNKLEKRLKEKEKELKELVDKLVED